MAHLAMNGSKSQSRKRPKLSTKSENRKSILSPPDDFNRSFLTIPLAQHELDFDRSHHTLEIIQHYCE